MSCIDELPTKLVGVQDKRLRDEQLTWTRKRKGTRACM